MAMWGNHIQRVKIVINDHIIEQVFIHSFVHLFSIPEIHQSGYRTCHYITTGIAQNES